MLWAAHAAAQTPVPDAGRILDYTKPPATADIPTTSKPGTLKLDERRRVANIRNVTKLDIKGYRVTGLRAAAGMDTTALLGLYTGPQKSFDDIEQAAEALQNAIRSSGVFLAQVDVPTQKVVDGIVELRVLEGQVDKIVLKPMPEGSRVKPGAIEALLNQIKPGDTITAQGIERALFLVGDLRGVNVSSVVMPGSTPGTAIIEVTTEPGRAVQGSIDFDNLGSPYTGQYRVSGTVEFNSPLGRGDLLKLNVQTSTTGGVTFLRGVYQTNVGESGLKLGIAESFLTYKLGTSVFSALDASGQAQVLSLFGLYPFQRGRNFNLFAQAGYDHRTFEDKQKALNAVSSKHSDVLQFSFVGDSRDSWLMGGVNSFQAGVTAGNLSLDSVAQLAADQAAAGRRTNGNYSKVNYALARQQLIWTSKENTESRLVLFGSLQGQFASKNLDSSEKIGLGGPTGVRAYPQGEGAGDSGHIASVELRKNLAFEGLSGDLVLAVFADAGRVTLNQRPLATDIPNRRILRGVGFGLTWAQGDRWFLKTSLAWHRGEPAQSDTQDRLPRFYLQLSRQF